MLLCSSYTCQLYIYFVLGQKFKCRALLSANIPTRSASDKVYQMLAHGRWFSLGSPASSTTKTGRHDIAENIVETGVKTPKIKIMLHNTCILLE
jgi:hypothetical protein